MASRREERLADRKYIAFDVLNRIASLEMRARHIVEGTMSGLQRSPHLGVSSEFAQHRPYVAGDDTRHMDWRVYARTERYYVRQFQEETNFVVTFLLDASESMQYGSTGMSKLDYACLLAASISYLVLRQSDAVSLAVFDENVVNYIPPRTGIGSLGLLATEMESLEATKATEFADVVPVITRMARRRGIVIVLSDLIDVAKGDDPTETGPLVRAIQEIRLHRHETIVLHTMDPQELAFDFSGHMRFEGLEAGPTAKAEPTRIRADYLEIVRQFLTAVRAACAQAGAEYALANTAEPAGHLLIRYLTARAKIREARR